MDSKIKGRVVHEEHNDHVIELSYTLLVMVLWVFLLVYSFQTFIKVLGTVTLQHLSYRHRSLSLFDDRPLSPFWAVPFGLDSSKI